MIRARHFLVKQFFYFTPISQLAIPGVGRIYGYVNIPGYGQVYPQVYPQGYPWYYPQGHPQGNPQGYPTNNFPGDTETFDPSTGPRNELPSLGGASEVDDLNKLIKLDTKDVKEDKSDIREHPFRFNIPV